MTASSPCIGLCVIDDASGACRGCGRTLAEIAAWGSYDEPQRRAVMATLQRRPRTGGAAADRPVEQGKPHR